MYVCMYMYIQPCTVCTYIWTYVLVWVCGRWTEGDLGFGIDVLTMYVECGVRVWVLCVLVVLVLFFYVYTVCLCPLSFYRLSCIVNLSSRHLPAKALLLLSWRISRFQHLGGFCPVSQCWSFFEMIACCDVKCIFHMQIWYWKKYAYSSLCTIVWQVDLVLKWLLVAINIVFFICKFYTEKIMHIVASVWLCHKWILFWNDCL